MEPDRPEPQALLAEAARDGRGRLKIYLGAAPGVGKTYAMLEEARMRSRAGMDVVVALVETHGRAETAALLQDLPVQPRRILDYRGQSLSEMDLDSLLARRPQLAVIDELAHSNIPGSRHPKRWQDVIEVLDAGIDVLTTLNIQHIESLNDVVARITGVRVQETLPDEVLQRANEIELIDLPPEELINRLREGKVYVADQVGRALSNFFSKGNLTALRELAMRTAAQRIDAEMIDYMRANAVRGPWPTQDRLLVCVNESPAAKVLVRAGKRMADRARIPWIAATVVTPRHEALGEDAMVRRTEALRLAQTLGAEVVTLHAESDAASELLTFARNRNVARLVIGRPRPRWPFGFLREAVSERLLDAATDFEVTVVAATENGGAHRNAIAPSRWSPNWVGVSTAVLGSLAATAAAWPLDQLTSVPTASLSVIFLLNVLWIGSRFGLGPALLAGLISFLSYNFFFTDPRFTFAVNRAEDAAAIFLFLLAAIFTGTLAGRLKAQVEAMRTGQRRTETLYDFANRIATATTLDDVLWAAAYHIAVTLNADSIILIPDPDGDLNIAQAHPPEDELEPRALAAARWAFEKAEPTGNGTQTLPTSPWLFVPLATAGKPLGVFGMRFRGTQRAIDPETMRLINAIENQVAIAIERARLASDLEDARVRTEGEKLRDALLGSVSHDLRTPLVSIIGSATGLVEHGNVLSQDDRTDLSVTILEEARRLDRYVQNLLDMTRLGHGALVLRRSAIDVREIIGTARKDLSRVLEKHRVTVQIPRDMPTVDVDPVLIGQAIINVLENAAKYSQSDSTIHVTAQTEGDFVKLGIRDEGPGIAESERERVFDFFYRSQQGDAKPGGAGLGLAIVKGLVEAHGGSVRAVASSQGHGTTIELFLPIARETEGTG